MAAAIRTHHWDDWSLDDLLAAKGSTPVSLVVPARNEAATVGDVVTRVREALVDTVKLLDEIVVIDSDSTDTTYDVATDAGAIVHRSAEIRPDLGTRPGKGEAMWKSLFVTRGEVVVFMDADLLDWDTHFVPGLLGPLLAQRPGGAAGQGLLRAPDGHGGSAVPFEGGRVTELVARPLIRLLFPELGALHQPLAGEWAVRRVALRDPVGADRLRRRAGRPGRHACAPTAPTRSPRSTSAPGRTGTSRCATSAAWPSRSWRPLWRARGSGCLDWTRAATSGHRRCRSDDPPSRPPRVRRRRHA